MQLDNCIKNYSNYIKSNIAPDEDNLGYKKMISLRDGLEKTYNWYADHYSWYSKDYTKGAYNAK